MVNLERNIHLATYYYVSAIHLVNKVACDNDTATKFGTGVDVQDVITHVKFSGESLRGSNFTVGRILAFSIDFA